MRGLKNISKPNGIQMGYGSLSGIYTFRECPHCPHIKNGREDVDELIDASAFLAGHELVLSSITHHT